MRFDSGSRAGSAILSGTRHTRAGFVLMAVLWMVVLLAGVTLVTNMAATNHLYAARNRVNSRVAYWRAFACLSRVRAVADEQIRDSGNLTTGWAASSRLVVQRNTCRVNFRGVGQTLDINHASEKAIRTALEVAGVPRPQMDSLLLTLSKRRRPSGSTGELLAVDDGLVQRIGADTLLGVDSARVDMLRAPAAVVAGALIDAPKERTPNPMMQRGAPGPAAWLLTVSAAAGDPPITTTIAVRLVMAGSGAAIQEAHIE